MVVKYLKKFIMKQKWRIQQIGSFVNTILLIVAVAGVYSEPMQKIIPVRGIFMVPLISIVALLTVMFAGWVWDQGLKLWHEEQEISAERNQYMMDELAPVSRIYCLPLWILTGYYVVKLCEQTGIDATELKTACDKAKILYKESEENEQSSVSEPAKV